MKQKLLLKSMLLLFALIAGSSSAWAADVVGTINFGSASGRTAINSTSVTGDDSQGNEWTITTVMTQTSFTQNASYSQVGASSKPATSITFTTTLPKSQTIKAFSAKFGGFTNTAGDVTLKVGSTTVGSGSLSGTTDVVVSATNTTTSGTVLTVTVTNIAKGVKCYYISYTYDDGTAGPSIAAPTFSPAAGAVAAGSTITLSHDADADAIRYTTDGTNPTKTTGTDYSAPITITTATTIKAIAIKGENVSSVASASYTITVTAPTSNLSGGTYYQGTEITFTSEGNTIYYNMTTDGSTPSDPTSASTEYTTPIVLGSGTTKIKAIAYDNYGNTSSVISRSYTGLPPTSLPFNWTGGGKSTFTALTGVVANGLGSDYASDHTPYLIKFDTNDDYIVIFMDEKPVKVTIGTKMIGGSSNSKIKVQESTDGATYTDVQELTISGSTNSIQILETTNHFANTTRFVKLLFVKGSNVGVGPISVFSDDDIPVTITPATWASFSNASALDFTGTGVTAYIAKKKDASNVTLSEIAKVPASTGIVVNAPAGIYAIPVLTDAADATTGNLLQPWLSAGTPTAGTYYTLAVSGGNPIFKISSGGTLAAGKAYLDLSGASAPILNVNFGEEGTTGINAVNGERFTVNGEFYNLAGQRVAQPTKGLYIVNGKKVIIK